MLGSAPAPQITCKISEYFLQFEFRLPDTSPMILRRFLGGSIAASRGHGKEAHEQRSGPPIQVQVNALILWQLLYVHYAARDGWYSVVCVSSVLLVNFKRSILCDVGSGLFSMFSTLSFFHV